MANKPFEIQSSTLTIGGVNLQAGDTSVVIPGVTQATSYKVEEVEDTGDQTQQFTQTVAVIDYVTYQEIVNQTGNGSTRADYITELDDDGYIDDLEVGGQGSYTSQEATNNANNDMYAYIGTSSASDRPIVPQDWVQIPFRPKMRAGEIESIGGGSGNQLVETAEGNTFALMDTGDVILDGEGPGGVDRGIVWQYGDNNDGLNSTVRQDSNGLTVRAWTEDGGGGPTGEGEESGYSAPVNIVTNQDLNKKTWTFDGAGSLTFPDGTIQTTAYTGQSGGGTTTVSKFVMVNEDGGVYGSDDGENWSGPYNSGLSAISRVAVGPDHIVYIGSTEGQSGNNLFHTTAWNVTPTRVDDPFIADWRKVRYFDNIGYFVAVGDIDGVPTYKYSSNGSTWTIISLDDTWAGTLNEGAGYNEASFTDIATNGTGFLLTTNSTVLGSFYVTAIALTTNSTIGQSEWLGDGMDFSRVIYSTGSFSGWFAFGPGNASATEDGWWLNSSTNPGNGSFSNSWGISDIGEVFADSFNYQPDWSELTIGDYNGTEVIVIATDDGQIMYWPTAPEGPYIVIPKAYTSSISSITSVSPAVLTWTDNTIEPRTGEKIVISGLEGYNGTYYRNGSNELFTDTGLTVPFDATGLTYTSGGTVTFSHGQYIDALGYANNKFYAANDDEEVFVSSDGGATWTEVAALNPSGGENGQGSGTAYMNDISGYVTTGFNQLVNGSNTFTLNADGTITTPTLTVNLHNGGNQQAQVLQFGDTQQVIITGPTPAPGDNAERLIIQGQNGGSGEGGDVYFWAGDADNNGGDIKIYAGDADSGTAGDSGGYINIEGGSGYSNGGDVTITGGSSTVNGGDVRIEGGSGSTPGKVQIQSLYSQWQFKPDGTLQLPTGGDIVDSNGTTVLGGTSTNGFDILADGTKQAIVYEQEGIANYSSELLNSMPSFLSATPRSPDRKTVDTHWGFDSTGMWFTGDNQNSSDGTPTPAYPVYTTDSFPSEAKAVVTFIFTLDNGSEDPGICFYPANGVPMWDWDPHPSRIAVMIDGANPIIYGLNRSGGANFSIDTGTSYRARVTYEPTKPLITLEVIDLNTNKVISTAWLNERLPEGQNYRIGFDGDWDGAGPGEKSYFSDLTITVGDDNLEVKTEFTLTGKVKLPSSVKGHINLEGPWQNGDDDIEYQAVTTHNGYAYIIGADEWQRNDQLRLYKYSLTTGELVWQKMLFAGELASFNISWTGGVYSIDSIANPGFGYILGEELYIDGWTFGGNSANGATIELTDVDTDGGGIISATITGTAPAGFDGSGTYSPINGENQVNPTGISYDAANDQLVVLFSIWGGPGDAEDSSWDRTVVLRASPDTGAVISSITLTDEGDVVPYSIDVGSTGTPVVAGQKFNEYRTFGTLTMLATGNGYFDILKTDLDAEHYPESGIPGDEANTFFIQGTGIATKAVVDSANYYPSTITNGTTQGSGTVDVNLVAPTPITFSLQDFTDTLLLDSTNLTKNVDNFVTNGAPNSVYLTIVTGSLATSITSLYTHGSVIPVTWGAGSTTTSGYAAVYFNGDGTIQFTATDASGTPVAGTWYFPAELAGGYGPTVTVNTGGTGYKVGHKIKYLGTQIPDGATPANDIILTVTGIDSNGAITTATAQGTLPASNVSGLNSGTNYNVGTGSQFNLTVNAQTGSISNSIANSGSNYVAGDTVIISGLVFANGASPANDITVTIVSVDVGGGITDAVISDTAPTDAIRVNVAGIDFTAVGGSWTMKQSLGAEAFVWTPSWNKAIGGSVDDNFNSVTYSNDGNSHIYAVGQGYYEVAYRQSLVVKFDATNGNILWSKFINSATTDAEATGVSSMPISTDIIVAGREYSTSLGNRWVGFVARMTAAGTVVWKRLLGNGWGNEVWDGLDVTVDAKENIYVSTAYQDNHGWINVGHSVTKFNPDGNILWMRTVNSSGASSDLGSWNGTGWSSFDETTQQLVVAGWTNSFDDNYRCGLWTSFPADGYTYFGGEGEFTQQGPWRFGLGSLNVLSYETVTAQDFTPTPLANNIDTIADAKYYRTEDPVDKFPQWLTTMADEVNGGLVFGDGSKQTFATNITPQVRAYQDYRLRPTDSGKHIYYGPNTNSGTIAIPYWDDVKLPVGFTFTIVNRCGGDVYVQLAGGNQTGSIYGSGRGAWSTMWGIPDSGSGSVVTLIKVEEGIDYNAVSQGDVWMISGPDSIYTN